MPLKWDVRQARFERQEMPAGEKIDLGSFGHVRIQKIGLHVVGDDIDIRMMKSGQNLGTNLKYLANYGVWNPNGDWYIPTDGTTASGEPYRHALFIPFQYQIDDLTLQLKNNDDVPRRLVTGRMVYHVPVEGGD